MAGGVEVSEAVAIRNGVSEEQAGVVVATFKKFDADSSGTISGSELAGAFEELEIEASADDIETALKDADVSGDGVVDFEEFCKVFSGATMSAAFKEAAKKASELHEVVGAVGKHSYSVTEKIAFSEHLNVCLQDDEFLRESGSLPLDPKSDDLFTVVSDGIALCKLLNLAVPESVDERTLNFPKKGRKLNPWEVTENHNLAINTAKSIGLSVVNMHAQDLADVVGRGTQYMVLGLLWQVVKLQLLRAVDLRSVPELVALVREGEELGDLVKLPAEDVLLRWINFHLEAAGSPRRVSGFGTDVRDGVAFATVLQQVGGVDIAPILAEKDPLKRAAAVIDAAKAMEVPAILQPADMIRANKRLNLAFAAQIFNTNHGLAGAAKEEEMAAAMEAAELLDEEDGSSKEERSFKMWLNSLDLGGEVVTSLDEDLSDGVILLKAIEALFPGTLKPKRWTADRAAMNRFQRIENCNYVIELCTKELGCSLPGIGGVDISGGNTKLIESVIWQLMRLQINTMLKSVGGGVVPKDADILKWANETVKASGSDLVISSFRDKKSLRNGLFLLELLKAVDERALNPDIITPGETEEEQKNNARYVIAVARKLGAAVFCTWEDLVAARPKIISTVIASIMFVAKAKEAGKAPDEVAAEAEVGAAAGGGGEE